MPPRKKKLVDNEDEVCPAKKKRQSSESRIESDRNQDGICLRPAKKLRKQLDEKDKAVVTGTSSADHDAELEVKSRYFSSMENPKALLTAQGKCVKSSNQKRTRGKRARSEPAVDEESKIPVTSETVDEKTTRTRKQKKQNIPENIQSPSVNIKSKEDQKRGCPKQAQKKATTRSRVKTGKKGTEEAKSQKTRKSNSVPHCPKLQTAAAAAAEEEEEEEEEEGGVGEKEDGNEKQITDSLDSSDSESEWEEVEELPVAEEIESWKSQIPEKPVQITLKGSELIQRKRGSFDINDYFRQQLNRFRTESQESAHKVHLLCLLSHGCIKNRACCDELLKSVAFSLIPNDFTSRPHDKWTLHQLTAFTSWFKKTIALEDGGEAEKSYNPEEHLHATLLSQFAERKATLEHEYILLFTISCRSVGLLTRLVFSLQPISSKPSDLKKKKSDKTASKETGKKETVRNNSQKNKGSGKSQNSKTLQTVKQGTSVVTTSKGKKTEKLSQSGVVEQCHRTSQSNAAGESENQSSLSSAGEDIEKPKNQRRLTRERSHRISYAEDTKSESDEDWKEHSEESVASNSNEKNSKRKKQNSSDDDFEEPQIMPRLPSSSSFQKRAKTPNRKNSTKSVKISDEDRFLITLKPFGSDWWTEVYVEEEHKWICINGHQLLVNRQESAEQQATKPLSYILSYDNDGSMKDLTMKYASDWMSSVKKARLDDPWWKKVLTPFEKQESERDIVEDAFIHEQLLKKPLPTSISDFKNHPLYALKRHLLKYEAIYPPTALVLGHIRGEPVYSRDCVLILHSKEKWRLEGRLVRIGEDPYKIVKARPKWNKPKEFNEQLRLPLFGQWQTEQFIPLPAVDGKISKNEYGNVEVFKPWMVPGGTVHLPETLNGLSRVAKKLDIDCAPAMVGWEFHNGFNHPILQGWIVCEEHRDILVAAWEEEQAIQRQKEAEKRQQRVLNNWRLLVRGLMIKERLKRRFNLQEPDDAMKHPEDGEN